MNKESALNILNRMDKERLLSLYKEANLYCGWFEFASADSLEKVCEFTGAFEIARAIIYGDVKNLVDPVYFDGNHNLYTISDNDLYRECMGHLDELLDWLEENYNHVDLTAYGLRECFD